MRGNFCVTGLPSANSSNTPRSTGSMVSKHVVLLDEAHFEVELVELAGQAVGARILVAEAWRDLEIAVEARDHEQLLVLLRRLRQRVELAGMDARRHQEVARTFRRRSRQDRRRIFGEARLAHALAHRGDDLRARHDVPVQRLAAQVEEAVLQPDVFRIIRLAEHRQRQLLGRRQHFELADEDSTSPVGSLAFTVSAARALTSPSTRITHSERTVSAGLNAANRDR